ncbi:hypothetical protein SNEBB_002451 [Seison nebaliae]|nr:hypothetical protein SNEBB_002451 [Seison nebaliae]
MKLVFKIIIILYNFRRSKLQTSESDYVELIYQDVSTKTELKLSDINVISPNRHVLSYCDFGKKKWCDWSPHGLESNQWRFGIINNRSATSFTEQNSKPYLYFLVNNDKNYEHSIISKWIPSCGSINIHIEYRILWHPDHIGIDYIYANELRKRRHRFKREIESNNSFRIPRSTENDDNSGFAKDSSIRYSLTGKHRLIFIARIIKNETNVSLRSVSIKKVIIFGENCLRDVLSKPGKIIRNNKSQMIQSSIIAPYKHYWEMNACRSYINELRILKESGDLWKRALITLSLVIGIICLIFLIFFVRFLWIEDISMVKTKKAVYELFGKRKGKISTQ